MSNVLLKPNITTIKGTTGLVSHIEPKIAQQPTDGKMCLHYPIELLTTKYMSVKQKGKKNTPFVYPKYDDIQILTKLDMCSTESLVANVKSMVHQQLENDLSEKVDDQIDLNDLNGGNN